MKLPAPKLLLTLLVAVAATAVALPSTATASPRSGTAGAPSVAYQVNAFGTRATLNGGVTAAPSAQTLIACTTVGDLNQKNAVDAVDLAPLLTAGAVNSAASTFWSPAESSATTDVQKVDLLKGLITADVLHSSSSTVWTESGSQSSSDGSFFTSLKIAGVPIGDKVPPNTVVTLKGYGYVVVNEQINRVGKNSQSLTVNALHLVIDQDNELGIDVGTSVVVADASSAAAGPVVGTLGGAASGTRVAQGNLLISAPSFLIGLPCLGTDGLVRTNGGDVVSVPGILEASKITTSAQGTVGQPLVSGETTASVDSVDLVKDLVVAKGVHADAVAATDGDKITVNDGKSGFEFLSVAGFPKIDAGVTPNTRIFIPDLGTLWLHRVIQAPTRVEVRMIELVVTKPNKLDLQIGTDIRVGVAFAIARTASSCLPRRPCP